MANILVLIALLLCWALPILAEIFPVVHFKDLPDDLKASFAHYIRIAQPIMLERSWAPVGWEPGYIHWWERNVFLGSRPFEHAQLSPFSVKWAWSGLYMDEEMLQFLSRIEVMLLDIRPATTDHRWFRLALAQALEPLHRRFEPMPSTIRRVVEHLIRASGEQRPQYIENVRNNVRRHVNTRYGPASYDRGARWD